MLVLTCAVLCSCSGQHPSESIDISKNNTITEDVNEKTIENTHDEPAGPPAMLIFNNIEGYIKFRNSIELSDDEFMLYISDNSFDMNGISSKDDVTAICALVNSIPLPNAQELSLTEMIIYPEREQCFFKYKTAEDVICSYLFDLDKNKSATISQLKQENWKAVSVSSNYINSVYYVENEGKDNFEAYYATIDNYLVLFRAYDSSSSDALELLISVDYATLAEQ